MNPVGASSSIGQLAQVQAGNQTSSKPGMAAKGPSGFADLVESFVGDTNQAQVSSDKAIQDLITGKTDNVEQVVMAVANAEMSFKLFMEIRDKLIQSYNDLMRMQF
ncbi:MAG: flagellar hook-basal body complex protein FliE [Mariniblastus sp.]|jgi:flagellar hook-basal body complex protein FliE